tara:strand:+ start:1861 stop:2778 length:918 start_codon:yes stop_codon:yes gene_type:complete
MNIFVTGGAGFIGSALTSSLIKNSNNVTIYDSLVNSSETHAKKLQELGADFVHGDITNSEHLSNSLKDFDICVHLAAQIDVTNSIKDPEHTRQVNVYGTKNMLNACQKNNVDVITASTAAVYHDSNQVLYEDSPLKPRSPYGESKLSMEKMINSPEIIPSDINCINLRMFNVYGKGQNITYAGVITRFLEDIKNDNDITIFGDGEATRDFISVNDVVDCIILSMKKIKGKHGQSFNVASGTSTKIKDLARLMISISKKDNITINHAPTRSGDIVYSKANILLAKESFDWSPQITLKEGLEQLINS